MRVISIAAIGLLGFSGACSQQRDWPEPTRAFRSVEPESETNSPSGRIEIAPKRGRVAAGSHIERDGPLELNEPFEVRFQESRFFRAHDMFLSADDPRVVSAEEATFLEDDDEVLGFVVDGRARCYGVRALCYHHVVNDRIGQAPIAVTY